MGNSKLYVARVSEKPFEEHNNLTIFDIYSGV